MATKTVYDASEINGATIVGWIIEDNSAEVAAAEAALAAFVAAQDPPAEVPAGSPEGV